MATIQVPQNYLTTAQSQLTVQTRKDVDVYKANNGDLYNYIGNIGLNQYEIQDVMVRMFGRQALFLPVTFEDMYNRQKPAPNYYGYRNVGREIMPNFIVKDTITGNGTGLSEVVIEVALEGGAGEHALSIGHEVVAGRRNFTVTDETTGTGGFQRITLKPNDGMANLSVVGNSSVEFPDNSKLGTLGVNLMPNCNDQNFKQLYTGYDQRISYKMTRKYMEFTRREDFVQNALTRGSIIPFTISGEDEKDSIKLFITLEEMKELTRFFNAVNASILYSQENLNPELGILQGNGLAHAAIPENRIAYSPSQINSRWISDLLFRYRQDNPDHGPLVWVLGDAIWDQLMYNLDFTYRPDRRMEPNMSPEDVKRQFTAGPNQYDRFIDTFGTEIRFVRLGALSNRSISSLRSPRNPNMGITAHDWFLMDMGPLHNFNLQTGELQAEADHKINFFSAQNLDGSADSLVDVSKIGMLDQNGNKIARGPVVSFERETVRRLEMSYAVELADEYSLYYGYLG